MNVKPLFGVILTLLVTASSFAAPQEKTQDTLTRTASSGDTVRAEMSLNVYRQEPYQANYTERVPYQTEETYYVDVPYQTTETYTENVPYTERVPYTDYEEYTDSQYVCKNVTRYREECRRETVCDGGASRRCENVTECGTNAHGERICKTREVCRNDGPPQCRDVNRCHQVPYTDQQCGYESVRKTRPVTRYRDETRYRQETRTRTVTKYRQEARTRTVTKYREETRCCVTKYRDVFDHQFTQPVTVIFPQEALLIGPETEQVQIKLSGTEQNPQVRVTVRSDVFNYEIAQTRQDGRDKVFVLKVVPKWTAENAGASSIQGLKLSFNQGQASVSFKETIASARMTAAFKVEVRDQQSQELLLQHQFDNSAARVIDVLVPGAVREGKYTITLKVDRVGSNIAGGSLSFTLNAAYEKKELDQDEIQLLRDKSQVRLVGIEGAGAERVIIINDATPALEEVQTTYKLVVWKKSSGGNIDWLGEKSFKREDITRNGQELGIALKALGLNPAAEQTLYMDLVVNRTSAQYLGGQKVQFIVNKTF